MNYFLSSTPGFCCVNMNKKLLNYFVLGTWRSTFFGTCLQISFGTLSHSWWYVLCSRFFYLFHFKFILGGSRNRGTSSRTELCTSVRIPSRSLSRTPSRTASYKLCDTFKERLSMSLKCWWYFSTLLVSKTVRHFVRVNSLHSFLDPISCRGSVSVFIFLSRRRIQVDTEGSA